jgi:hypothetical protein
MARGPNSVDLAWATGYQVVPMCEDALLLVKHGSLFSDLEREIDCRRTQLWYSGYLLTIRFWKSLLGSDASGLHCLSLTPNAIRARCSRGPLTTTAGRLPPSPDSDLPRLVEC